MPPTAPASSRNRLFVALDLPDDLRAALAAAGARIAADAGGRAVPPENLHVTLAFLGEVAPAPAARIADRLDDLASMSPARVRIGALAARPSPGRARLVAVELVDTDGALADIAARVLRACADALPGRDDGGRPFWPHVTVTRFSRPANVRGFPPVDHEHVFDITRASLYDSHICPGRPPRYEALKEVTLDGSFAERSPQHG